MSLIKTLTGDIEADQLTAPVPSRKFRDAWSSEGTVIVIDPVAKAEILKGLINKERDRRIALGHTVTLSDGTVIQVQTRDEKDFRNINGLVSQALVYSMMNNLTEEMTFWGADNTEHTLTPAKMIEMGSLVGKLVEGLYAKGRALKVMDPIPDDYDNDAHWT